MSMLSDEDRQFLYYLCKYMYPLDYRYDEVEYEMGDTGDDGRWEYPPRLVFYSSDGGVQEFVLNRGFFRLPAGRHKITTLLQK